MKKEEVLLKIARLKLEFEQKQLERYETLVRHSALPLESLDEQKLKLALAQCDVDLAEIELEGVNPMHPACTYLGDRVLYYKAGCPDGHVAFVIKVHSEHCACLVYYCPVSHAWQEVSSVAFGKSDGDYYVNTEA